MKSSLLLTFSLIICSSAHAGLCTQSDLDNQSAQAFVQKMQSLYNSGAASAFDVLIAQKHLLELKLCNNSSDYASYKDLAANAMNRLKLAKNFFSQGLSNSSDVNLVTAEVAGLSEGCPSLLDLVKHQLSSGTKTSQDVANVQSACDTLNGK